MLQNGCPCHLHAIPASEYAWPQYLLDPNTIEFILLGKETAKHASQHLRSATVVLPYIFSKKILHFVFFSIFVRNVRQYVACRELEKSTFPLGFVCICNLHLPKAAFSLSLSISVAAYTVWTKLCMYLFWNDYMNQWPLGKDKSCWSVQCAFLHAKGFQYVVYHMHVSMWLYRCTRCNRRYMRTNVTNKPNQKQTHFNTSLQVFQARTMFPANAMYWVWVCHNKIDNIRPRMRVVLCGLKLNNAAPSWTNQR